MKLLRFVVLALIVSSCASSLVYSPHAHVSSVTSSGATSLSLGGAFAPETRPNVIGRVGTFAGETRIGYSFSESFRLDGRYFLALEDPEVDSRHGFGVTGTGFWGRDRTTVFHVTSQFVLDGGNVEGGGGSVQFGKRWMTETWQFSAIVGPMFGMRNLGADQYGIGGLANFGSMFKPDENIGIGFDLAVGFYRNVADGVSRGLISPGLLLTITL